MYKRVEEERQQLFNHHLAGKTHYIAGLADHFRFTTELQNYLDVLVLQIVIRCLVTQDHGVTSTDIPAPLSYCITKSKQAPQTMQIR